MILYVIRALNSNCSWLVIPIIQSSGDVGEGAVWEGNMIPGRHKHGWWNQCRYNDFFSSDTLTDTQYIIKFD